MMKAAFILLIAVVFRTLTYWGLILGLIAFIGSRIWYTSFVPAWWDNTSNSVIIALGVIATLDKIASGE